MEKNFADFLGFLGLGSCALDDFLGIWWSVSEEERSQVSQKPTKFLETLRENWRRVIFIRLRINEADSGIKVYKS